MYRCSSERERMKESADSDEKCIRDASRVDEEGDHRAVGERSFRITIITSIYL